jgi:hypothetical protein
MLKGIDYHHDAVILSRPMPLDTSRFMSAVMVVPSLRRVVYSKLLTSVVQTFWWASGCNDQVAELELPDE